MNNNMNDSFNPFNNTVEKEELSSAQNIKNSIKTEETKPKKKKKSIWLKILGTLSFLAIVSGILIIFGNHFYPETTEKLIYSAKVEIEKQVQKANEVVTGDYPTVLLGGEGGEYEMQITPYGYFIEMIPYRVPGLMPVYAAHNSWGGDEILQWDIGKKVNLEGSNKNGVWVVVDILELQKQGTVDLIEPLEGVIALQTCYYGQDLMKFVGLVPEEVYNNGWPPAPELPQSGGNLDKEKLSENDKQTLIS